MTADTQAADALMAVFGFKRVEQDKPSEAPLPVRLPGVLHKTDIVASVIKDDQQPTRVYTKG